MSDEENTVEQAEELIETIVPGLSKEEYKQIRSQALEEAATRRHAWVMKGPYLVCTSCSFPHRSLVGIDKVLVGIDEAGNPILKPKVLQKL